MTANRVVAQSSNTAGIKEYRFYCDGCKQNHMVNEGWAFNGDFIKPSFTPSILVRSGHYLEGHKGESCWCTFNAERPDNPSSFKCGMCHSFVTDGKIQYLSDCTHELAGKTIDLKPID